MKPVPAPPDDESLDELPPMDGADGDEGEPAAEDLDEDSDEGAADPFDDATGEGDPLDETTVQNALGTGAAREVVQESGWLVDSAEADDLEIGAHDLEIGERDDLRSDVDEPGVGDEDFGLGADESKSDIDGGEEGPDAADEELREEDLPELDADDEGELEDPALGERWLVGALSEVVTEEARPAWDDRAWDRVALVARAALDAAGVAAGAVTALSAADGLVVLATDRDPRVYASSDDGKTFAVKDGWHCRAHTLFAGDTLPESGALAATVERDGTPVVLLRGDGDDLAISRGKEGAEPVPVAADVAVLPNMAIAVASRAPALALGQHGAGAYRALDGVAWSRIEGTASTTALAFVDDAGTLLVALYSPAEERTWLVRVGADGVAHTVAELGGDDTDDLDVRVHAIAWDEPRRIAWVAGAFGIAGFRRV